MKALFDTNILIDFLRGISLAQQEFGRYTDKAISVVSWMEVMVGAPLSQERSTLDFLHTFDVVELDEKVAERAVHLRRDHKIKLPDAIIWASAQVRGMLLITRDIRGFPPNDPGVRMPYRI